MDLSPEIRQSADIEYFEYLNRGHRQTVSLALTTRHSSAWSVALARFGPANPVAVLSLSDASDSQCRAGRLAEGARSARSALDAARKAFGQHGGLPDAAAFALASCLIPAGQVEEAARLLVGIDPTPMAQLTGDAAWGANLALAQGQIAWRRGQFEAARKYLDTARPGISRPEADPYRKRAFETPNS